MARVTYIKNHHGSNGYRIEGQSEEVSDDVAKGLVDTGFAEIVKEEKGNKEAAARETKEDKDANSEDTK